MLNGLYEDALKYYGQAAQSTGYSDWSTLYNDMAYCQTVLQRYPDAMNSLNTANAKAVKAIEDAEKEMRRNPDALPYHNPYEYVPVLNTAIICDYLSYPQINPFNSNDYVAVRLDWYGKAEAMVAASAQTAANAVQQQNLNDIRRRINLRKSLLEPSK